jgi:hypothetical protein
MAEMEDIYKVDENGNPYSLEKSLSGTNAFYINDCAVAGHTAAYCSCLKKIMDNQNARLPAVYQSCGEAIDRNQCKAARLRREEVAAGHALYFISRARLNVKFEAERAALQDQIASYSNKKSAFNMPIARPAPKPAPVEFDSGGGDYAAAINKAMLEAAKPEPKKEVVVEPVAPKAKSVVTAVESAKPALAQKPGLSLIEMARAKLAASATN